MVQDIITFVFAIAAMLACLSNIDAYYKIRRLENDNKRLENDNKRLENDNKRLKSRNTQLGRRCRALRVQRDLFKHKPKLKATE